MQKFKDTIKRLVKMKEFWIILLLIVGTIALAPFRDQPSLQDATEAVQQDVKSILN